MSVRKLNSGLTSLLVFFCVSLSAWGGAANGQQNATAPNIILIMADDVGYECFGCYGSEQYATPNIDRLASQGMRFDHCYSQPLCTPTRVKLMTGLSNVRNYSAFSVLNRDQKTIGQYFKNGGYDTVVVGKWQLFGAQHYSEQFRSRGTMPGATGFDHSCLWQVDQLGERYPGPLMWTDGENRQFGQEAFGPDVATDYLIDFIQSSRDRPFFAYYPMILPHSPFVPTPHSKDAESKNRQRNFEDMVAYVDHLVGKIARAVDNAGLTEKTMIVFTGDNGTGRNIQSTLHGETIQGGKGLTTDAGTHVPLVISWPGTVPAGSTCEDLVDCSDFLPTVLDAATLESPKHLDGQSFLPQLKGLPGTPRDWLFCYYCPRPEKTPPTRFARNKKFKLYGDGRFFEIPSDRLEKNPLAIDRLTQEQQTAFQLLSEALNSMPTEGEALLKFPTQ
jgi:arylsulfatase A